MRHKSDGITLIVIGVLLILSSLGLTAYNLLTQQKAGQSAEQALQSVAAAVAPTPDVQPDGREEQPLYRLNPNVSMPETEAGGIAYIGYLSIPALELELPVITRTTDYYLTVAPCRFAGSAYLENLVIGAHNYATHFGRLKELSYGDAVIFTDMDGNVFSYVVADMETLAPDQDEYLRSGEYPLSLYTCTVGGRTRLTVRCTAAE